MSYKRRYTIIFDKICSICGDKANGRNFGAISCESCKAFFRRTMSSGTIQTPKCSFDNNCKITPDNRKSCKKCRLDKCFAVGMRKELIIILNNVNERGNDHQIRNSELVMENRNCCDQQNASQQFECQDYSPSSSWSEDTQSTRFSDYCLDSVFPDMSDMGNELESLVEHCLNDEDMSLEFPELEEWLTDFENSSGKEVTQTETTTSLLPIVRPINTFDKPLNDFEISRLQELNCASDKFALPKGTLDKRLIVINSMGQLCESMGAHQLADPMIMAGINFCKNMSLFQEICEEDRLTLFKKNSWVIVSLKHLPNNILDDINQTITFEMDNYTFLMNLASLRVENELLYDLGSRFWQKLNREIIKDPILINLMMAIGLFNIECPNLKHKENIKLHQQMYLYLIQRYLIQKLRSEDKFSQSLAQLMNIPIDLQQIGVYNIECAKDYKHLFSPLAKEIFEMQ